MASKWYYRVGDEKQGPIESKALKLLAEVGQITPNTLVQKEGAKSWAEASRVKGLFESQPSDSVIAPPVLNNSNQDKGSDVPIATEYAFKVAPAISEMPPTVITNPEGNESHKEFLEHKRRRRSTMPLIFTVTGIFVGIGLVITIASTERAIPVQEATQAPKSQQSRSHVDSRSARPSLPEEQVFLGIRSYSDGSKSRTRLANMNIQMRITDVWLAKSEKTLDAVAISPEFTMHVLLETENLDRGNAFTVHREAAVRSDANSLDPYAPLARNGADQFLTLTEALSTRTIPAGGKIIEKLSFTMASDKIENFKLAVPLAWFRQTGYMGYNIPNVMVGRDSSGITVAQTPDLSLSEPDRNTEENPDNAVRGQTQRRIPVSDKTVADEEPVEQKNGQLPPRPDFGSPNNPEGKNGDQPEDIKSLQESIKSSVEPANTSQQVEDEPPVKSAEPAPSTQPIFK